MAGDVKKFNKEDKKLSKRISSMREFRLKREFLTNMLISGLPRKVILSFFLEVFKNEMEPFLFGN